jgi:hypothetical protein
VRRGAIYRQSRASGLVSLLVRRIGHPRVVGQMAAGICLGPSLLGCPAPGVSTALFPPESLGCPNALSQAGLLLFTFLIAVEFDPGLLRGRGRTALPRGRRRWLRRHPVRMSGDDRAASPCLVRVRVGVRGRHQA